ncbi:hypothetical protein Q7P37_001784 [Cladosporium fusiforme]
MCLPPTRRHEPTRAPLHSNLPLSGDTDVDDCASALGVRLALPRSIYIRRFRNHESRQPDRRYLQSEKNILQHQQPQQGHDLSIFSIFTATVAFGTTSTATAVSPPFSTIMPWLDASTFSPSLPDHCTPTNDFLFQFSSTFHVCIPTPLAFTSNLLGALSICSWLFAQLPQIYKNYNIKSTSGLSIFFLVEWCLGDLGNLLGALFTHQAHWQVVIGGYYVFVDLCLVMQWVWYERLRHGRHLFRIRTRGWNEENGDGVSGMEGMIIQGISPRSSTEGSEDNSIRKSGGPRPIFKVPAFRKDPTQDEKASPSPSTTPRGHTIHRSGPSSPFPSPSPRTMLMLACLVAMTQASPIDATTSTIAGAGPTKLETAGTILSWLSTFLYLGSRLPQIYKNYTLQSTAGLSPSLFAAAFCGNLFYSAALATNPLAWSSMEPYGGHGWAGAAGSDRDTWVTAAMPFFLGAAGVLALDASVGVQFLLYGESDEAKVVVVDVEEGRGEAGRWRRVSGWMRGWVPTFGETDARERQGLLEGGHGESAVGYGALP